VAAAARASAVRERRTVLGMGASGQIEYPEV
jgi:hypothetical protein